jgi:sugar phosphate isomerase/epimerase
MGIGLATYAVRNELKKPEFGFKGMADWMVKHDIKLLELNNMFVKPETVAETVKIFTDRGVKPNQLTVDGNNFFQKSESGRANQMAFMKPWIDAAHSVGIPTIRANMGHALSGLIGLFKKTDTLDNLVATFRPILEYTENLGINFVFENHGGKSSDVEFQLKVKAAFPSKRFGYLLDFGNYRPKPLVYENIPKLGKAILAVHAKTYNFDAEGNETTLDVGKIVSLLKQIGYSGDYNIEFEGPLPDLEGVEKTAALLRKYL